MQRRREIHLLVYRISETPIEKLADLGEGNTVIATANLVAAARHVRGLLERIADQLAADTPTRHDVAAPTVAAENPRRHLAQQVARLRAALALTIPEFAAQATTPHSKENQLSWETFGPTTQGAQVWRDLCQRIALLPVGAPAQLSEAGPSVVVTNRMLTLVHQILTQLAALDQPLPVATAGDWLQEQRRQRRWTLDYLAQAIRRAVSTLSEYESAAISVPPEVLQRVVDLTAADSTQLALLADLGIVLRQPISEAEMASLTPPADPPSAVQLTEFIAEVHPSVDTVTLQTQLAAALDNPDASVDVRALRHLLRRIPELRSDYLHLARRFGYPIAGDRLFPEMWNTFAEYQRYLRVHYDLTPGQLATLLGAGISAQALCRFEAGQPPSPRVIQRLCEAFPELDITHNEVAECYGLPLAAPFRSPTLRSAMQFRNYLAELQHLNNLTSSEMARLCGVSLKGYQSLVEKPSAHRDEELTALMVHDRFLHQFLPWNALAAASGFEYREDEAGALNLDYCRSLGHFVRFSRLSRRMKRQEFVRIPGWNNMSGHEEDRTRPSLSSLRAFRDAAQLPSAMLPAALTRFVVEPYCQETGHTPPNEPEFWQYIDTPYGSTEERAQRNALVETYLWIPQVVARSHGRNHDERGELMQIASRALISTVERHIPYAPFSAHAWANCVRNVVFRREPGQQPPTVQTDTAAGLSLTDALGATDVAVESVPIFATVRAALRDAPDGELLGAVMQDHALDGYSLAEVATRRGLPIERVTAMWHDACARVRDSLPPTIR